MVGWKDVKVAKWVDQRVCHAVVQTVAEMAVSWAVDWVA